MKNFTRFFAFAIAVMFAFTAVQAQNTVMTKAQALGLKTSGVNHTPAVPSDRMSDRATLLEEGFDDDSMWPPDGWEIINFHPSENWIQSNPDGNNFDQIDPNSLFSALVPWIGEDQDEWLISPTIDAGGELPLNLKWYAGCSGPWLDPGATLRCLISTDDGATWTELWNAIDVIDPAAEWAWNYVSINLDDYADMPFKLAWNYVGNDGDLVGVDGVKVASGYDWMYYTDFEDYEAGEYVAEGDETGFWTTWTDSPGGPEDAFVTDQMSRGTNSAEVEGSTTDLLLLFGNKTSGIYYLQTYYYIEEGYGGYINIQHMETPGVEWAHEVYFGADPLSGDNNGYMYAGSADSMYFQFEHNTWIKLSWMVDLNEDWIQFYMDDEMMHEWQFSLQAQGDPGTNMLGSFDIYAGAPEGSDVHYYFDDIGIAVIDPGVVSPIIDIDNSPITVILEQWQTQTETFSMGNMGEQDLDYQIVTTYPMGSKEPAGVPGDINQDVSKLEMRQFVADPDYTPAVDNPSTREEVLNYDGDNFSAIGNTTADYTYRVGAMFPADIVQPYIGMEIYKVEVYINDPATSTTLQIYGMGDFNDGQPGEMMREQSFSTDPIAWNTVMLDDPYPIDGSDVWVTYEVSGVGGTFVPGTDEGPANENGDYISTGPSWGHLSSNPDLNYNWNVRAYLQGDAITQWLSTDPVEGTLEYEEFIDVDVMIDAANLDVDQYTGKLIVRNNDPENSAVNITVSCLVLVGVNEQGENEYVAVYPNPATDRLTINSNGDMQHISIVNSIGQLVYQQDVNMSKTTIDISSFQKGVYFVTVDTKNGSGTQKIIVE